MKKKSVRHRIPENRLKEESHAIAQFCLTYLKTHPTHNLPVKELYQNYRAWALSKFERSSALKIDGFGRLLPRTLKRKSMRVAGKTCRVIQKVTYA